MGVWVFPPTMCYHEHVENRIASLVVDAADAELLAQFWVGALGWQVVNRGSYGVSIGVEGSPFEIDFRFVPDGPKPARNRLHRDDGCPPAQDRMWPKPVPTRTQSRRYACPSGRRCP